MKFYRGLVAATVDALQDIFLKHRQADRVVEKLLKSNPKWGARDRAFIAENTYEIVRWWRLILYVADINDPEPEDLWKVFGAWQVIKPIHFKTESVLLPEWPEFAELHAEIILERYQSALEIRKIAQSVPDWLDETGEKELGTDWERQIIALNRQSPVVLRVNTLKTNVNEVREIFGVENTDVIPEIPTAIVLKKRQNVLSKESFKNGFFEVQDAGSQLIAAFMDLKPGQSVIDACAGAGGKTLHIAALLSNSGDILAMDIERRKLEELEKRAARNGVENLKTILIESETTIQSLSESTDRLLLDVPCSGLGVLKRNPDSKWKLTPKFLDSIRNVQWQILTTYCKMVKKGGKMVYATCSILPSESEDQVRRFIQEHGKQWKLIREHRTSVENDGYDGFYMALIQRK